MTKNKITRDLMKTFKNLQKNGGKCMKSPLFLYGVLLLAVSNLFLFISNEDNESLFLFIIISTLVYTKTNNMIAVLLFPLVIVNLLIYLRETFIKSQQEGFDMDTKINDFIKWFDNNVDETEIPPEEDTDGSEFYNEFVKPMFDVKDKDDSATLGSMKTILALYSELENKSEEGGAAEEESAYIKDMIDKYITEFSEETKEEEEVKESKIKEKKTKESFTEGYEDEDEDDYEDGDEDYEDDYTNYYEDDDEE